MAQFGSLCQTCFASSVSVRVLYHCCCKHVESLMEVINFYFSLAILSSWWADAEMVLFPRSSFWNTDVVYIFLIRREQWFLLIFKALFCKLKKAPKNLWKCNWRYSFYSFNCLKSFTSFFFFSKLPSETFALATLWFTVQLKEWKEFH